MVEAEIPDADQHPSATPAEGNSIEDEQRLRQFIREELAQSAKAKASDLPFQDLVASIRTLERRLDQLEQRVGSDTGETARPGSDELRQMNDYAVQLYYMDQLDEAAQMLMEAGKKYPKCVEVWNNLAVVYCALGQRDDAAQAFAHAIDLDPEVVELLNNQGVLALLEAHGERALEMLEEAHRRAPDEIDILANLAQAQLSLGQHANAIKSWKIITSLDPDHEEAKQYLRRFYQ